MASSEIRPTDRPSAISGRVLHMALKMTHYNFKDNPMMFRQTRRARLHGSTSSWVDARSWTSFYIEPGFHNWYFQHRAVLARASHEILRDDSSARATHVFVTLSESEIHWERLLETLPLLHVDRRAGRASAPSGVPWNALVS
ncbi:hypothetical protein MRX96_020405 [Rhipicephalus microplus]